MPDTNLLARGGIDYTNPFLGGAFGPGNKVIGGFDFVGDAYGAWHVCLHDYTVVCTRAESHAPADGT